MKRNLLKKYFYSTHFWKWVGFLVFVYWLFYENTLHESYPDEFDNILGGWYIIHGKLIYSGFWSQHNPFGYFLAGFIELFSGRSFVEFRYVYSIFLFLLTFGVYWYFRQRFGVIYSRIYLIFSVITTIAATYFWGHMLLADSISGFFFSFVFEYFLLQYLSKVPIRFRDIVFVSVFTFLGLLSSFTYVFLSLFVYLYLAYLYFTSFPFALTVRSLIRAVLIVGIPFVIFLIYLLVTGSISDYIYQSIIFNEKYYIYFQNVVGPPPKNPIRQMIVIVYNFYSNFETLLIQVSNFSFTYPFNVSLAVADTALMIYLFIQKRFQLLAFVFLFFAFANARSNPLNSRETDYQSAVYIMASLFSMCFILYTLSKSLQLRDFDSKRIIYTSLFAVVFIYSFFNVMFLVNKFNQKAFAKYMGVQAEIYDRPEIAPIINSVASKDDYAWIGPFSFEDLFYMNAKIPSKYDILIPGMGKSNIVLPQMIADFSAHKPKVMYFNKNFYILGNAPFQYAKPFINFVNDNYITLSNYSDGNTTYKSVSPPNSHIDLESNLYINKNDISEVIPLLVKKNYIKTVQNQVVQPQSKATSKISSLNK